MYVPALGLPSLFVQPFLQNSVSVTLADLLKGRCTMAISIKYNNVHAAKYSSTSNCKESNFSESAICVNVTLPDNM